MKSFVRAKYGEPETRKDLMLRLKNERADLEKRKVLAEQIKSKNKDEFHFAFHNISKNMVKNKKLKLDELKKTLKYVDNEIKRCERKMEATMDNFNDRHLIFDGAVKIKKSLAEPSRSELKSYVEEMKSKRSEIVLKISERS